MNIQEIMLIVLLFGGILLLLRASNSKAKKRSQDENNVLDNPDNQIISVSTLDEISEEMSFDHQIEHTLDVNPEIIAAISAALVAFEQDGKKLVIRSVRKATNIPAWNQAGRLEQLSSRL